MSADNKENNRCDLYTKQIHDHINREAMMYLVGQGYELSTMYLKTVNRKNIKNDGVKEGIRTLLSGRISAFVTLVEHFKYLEYDNDDLLSDRDIKQMNKIRDLIKQTRSSVRELFGKDMKNEKIKKQKNTTEIKEECEIKFGVCPTCEENISKDKKRSECICDDVTYKTKINDEEKIDHRGNRSVDQSQHSTINFKGGFNCDSHVTF